MLKIANCFDSTWGSLNEVTRHLLTICFFFLFFDSSAASWADCFIATQDQKTLVEEGDCSVRETPASTFKIALSLMGFDEGFLKDATHPKLDFQNGDVDWLPRWRQPHTPALWIKNSCVWYSHRLTRHLGQRRLSEYVNAFGYGNQAALGNHQDGLERAWLSDSLQITPHEQIAFLGRLTTRQLPIRDRAYHLTQEVLSLGELKPGWHLYGKTGNGYQATRGHVKTDKHQVGWFVGWLERPGQTLLFAQQVLDSTPNAIYASTRAAEKALTQLNRILFVGPLEPKSVTERTSETRYSDREGLDRSYSHDSHVEPTQGFVVRHS